MNRLRDFVRRRLDSLEISVAEAERRGNLNRGFIGDILRGQKSSVGGANLGRLAAALSLDTADLVAVIEGRAELDDFSQDIPEGLLPVGSQSSTIPEAAPDISVTGPGAPFFRSLSVEGGEQEAGFEIASVRDQWCIPGHVLRDMLGSRSGDLVMLPLTRDVPETDLLRGDYVLVDLRRRLIEPDGVWALDEGYGTMIRRIRPTRRGSKIVLRMPGDGDSVDERSPDQITVIGRIIARFSAV